MIESLEELGLDPDRVRRQRDASLGVGRGYLTRTESLEDSADRELALFAAATNFRRAAANSLLLGETEQATGLFHQAARAYVDAGASYGLFLENLGHEERLGDRRWIEAPKNAGDVFWLWSPDAVRQGIALHQEWVISFRRQLDGYRTERVGVLGLPVGIYLELFDSLALSPRNATEEAVREAIFPFLGAYAAAVRRCRSDQYHWTRLTTPFHPVEPDVLGTLVALNSGLTARQASLRGIITGLPIGTDALKLLSGTLRQFGAWGRHTE